MTVPPGIASSVERALTRLTGQRTRIEKAHAVRGGCISPSARIETDAGDRHFLKWSDPPISSSFFAEEARSLRALAETDAVRVPAVLESDPSWLLLEWLEPGSAGPSTWETLGRNLAVLHGNGAESFGWPADNWIGSLPQGNASADDWPGFWMERRIVPQWDAARRRGFFDASDQRAIEAMRNRAGDLFEAGDRDGPSLLHGDLWGGNVHVMADGTAALIDPSTWYGHREVDLAMARLFGGFDAAFFDAYDEARPLEPGFAGTRCEAYQMYYLLVHVNLFGAGYVDGVKRILQRFD